MCAPRLRPRAFRAHFSITAPSERRGNRIPSEDKTLVPGRCPAREGENDSRGRKPDAHVVSKKEGARAALER